MEYRIGTGSGLLDNRFGSEVAFDDGNGFSLEPPEFGPIADQAPHFAALKEKMIHQVAPDKARPPRDEASADFPGRHMKIYHMGEVTVNEGENGDR
jgi:hypothetical protein